MLKGAIGIVSWILFLIYICTSRYQILAAITLVITLNFLLDINPKESDRFLSNFLHRLFHVFESVINLILSPLIAVIEKLISFFFIYLLPIFLTVLPWLLVINVLFFQEPDSDATSSASIFSFTNLFLCLDLLFIFLGHLTLLLLLSSCQPYFERFPKGIRWIIGSGFILFLYTSIEWDNTNSISIFGINYFSKKRTNYYLLIVEGIEYLKNIIGWHYYDS
jgi:hypothetical protein